MVGSRRVAVIPARGGSKRIERKNLLDFHGKPMLAWTIDAALRSERFERVIVSTDDAEIADVARRHGAAVPFLRREYADDQSPVSLATIETLQRLADDRDEQYDVVAQLLPNCPLRDERHIQAALQNFMSRSAKSQISCFKFGWMNPWWAVTLAEDGRPGSLFPDAMTARSQDLPELYCPTGAVWIADVAHLREHRTFHTPDRIYWPLPWEAAVDIDGADDLRMAQLLFELRKGAR